MTALANVDYAGKRLYLHADTVTNGIDISHAYIELINLFIANANNEQSYYPPLDVQGNAPKGGGKFTQMYGVLRTGWRIVPYGGVSHTLRILREIVSEDGISDRNVFDRAPVPPTIVVEIDSDYDKIEIREVATSGNTYTLAEIGAVCAGEVWDSSMGSNSARDAINLIQKIQSNKMITDPITGVLTIFEDDGVTPFLSGQLFKDASGTETYSGLGAERREKLS